MDERDASRPDGSYAGHDDDFGMFRPSVSQSSQYPAASWTQFSGIHPPGGDQSGFTWDSFVTPPSTPSSATGYDSHNPNLFSNFGSVSHAMGRKSPTEYDGGVEDDDSAMLASTPLAKSLLEALNSQTSPMLHPANTPLLDTTMPVPDSMNYSEASRDGFDMYTEALKKLGSTYESGSYTPFGTADVLSAPPPSPLAPMQEADNQNASNVKPSYSEVAKTLKTNPSSGKEKEDSDQSRKKSSLESSTASRPVKTGKKGFVPRPIRGRSNVQDTPLPVSSDSKYGLDDFSDYTTGKGEKGDTSISLDSIPVVSRKGSTSSVSSGTSGIEEIHLSKQVNSNIGNTSEGSPNIEKISSNKDKEKAFDEKLHKSRDEKPFFDARRIFQSKDTNKRRSQPKGNQQEDFGPTILNNGKPAYGAWCSSSAHKKSTHYINNNLRDSQKKTNQYPSGDAHKGQASEENAHSTSNAASGHTEKGKTRTTSTSSKADKSTTAKPNMPLQPTFDQELIEKKSSTAKLPWKKRRALKKWEKSQKQTVSFQKRSYEWLSFLYDKAKLCFHQLWTLVLMVILLIFSIIVYLVTSCVHILSWGWTRIWHFLETRVFRRRFFTGQGWRRGVPDILSKLGLEENITLPSTGDEAMQRLLACKGKDPYSILGLTKTAADEDIKKYYRRQAVLVHPDKNQQPGAEEAFKILGHAFDLIGDAGKRQAYDRQLHEATEAENAMREFNDLLSKLQEKIHQASNMMRCDNCGGKHKRVPIDRPWYSARFCDRCSIRHSAKEGDVWAETSMLGFLWHYYACMEGKVYDITDWVACKKDFFKHMQANAHHVFYRIATEGNRGHHRSGNSASGPGGEPDLEDFISQLFHQAMTSEASGSSQSSWQQPQQSANGQPWNGASSAQPSAGQAGKRTRRKKKKH